MGCKLVCFGLSPLNGYLLDTSSVYFATNFNSQFNLGKGWTAELNSFYRNALMVGQIISGNTGQANIGLSKKIIQDKGSSKLNIRDLFYTRINHGIIPGKGAYATYRGLSDTRNILISFVYYFGKTTTSLRSRKSGC